MYVLDLLAYTSIKRQNKKQIHIRIVMNERKALVHV